MRKAPSLDIPVSPDVVFLRRSIRVSADATAGVVINVTFETGCEKYKDLERGLFVGAGRFILDGSGLGVEYKVSRVGWRPP
jgi:hypothetical protein